mmetsp:Transcript_24910/g.39086  ORF Transcript_24910/g.39086 Transcript_24910/m.39086 type:complete len:290 (-) Transcript_24910:126-995(-)
MVEVYGDSITSLLEPEQEATKPIQTMAVTSGRCSVKVEDLKTLETLLIQGVERRRRASTLMNERSSRAHLILMLHLTKTLNDGRRRVSYLTLADLGGAEQVSRSLLVYGKDATRKDPMLDTDSRMTEAIYINLGLLALRNCVRALLESSPHVPYSRSKLTSMLKKALGGNCFTTVLVTCSSETKHALQTIESLRFGSACSRVSNAAESNPVEVAVEALQALNREIEELEEAIKQKERWETGTATRIDPRYQDGEVGAKEERVTTSTIVGAEAEREKLGILLARRDILTS